MGEAKRRRLHCAYCGSPSTSVDHVPPKSVFAGDRTNLITVPACDLHNGRRSNVDERFREFIAFTVGIDTPDTLALWKGAVRGLRRHSRRVEEVRSSMRYLPELDRYAVPVDASAFAPMMEWITRGLYWHFFRERLPLDVQIEAKLMRGGAWLAEFTSDMARVRVGGEQFFVAYQRMAQHPTISAWVYVFYNRVVGMALTDMPLADALSTAERSREAAEAEK